MKPFFLEGEGYRAPQWRLSLVVSVVIHVLAVFLIFYVPQAKKEKTGTPFVTRLVSPEELGRTLPPEPPVKARPGERSTARPAVPARPVPPAARQARPRSEVPSAPSSPGRTGPRDVSRGPAPETAPGAASEKTAPGQEASSGAPGGGAPGGGAAGQQRAPSRGPSPSLKEKLFDREIVEKYAKREESAHDSSITFDTREFKYEMYMRRLKERIEGIWYYPPDAARRGIYGDLLIRFTILKNGRLSDVELMRTSGHRDLDQAAMQALKEGAPYWPLPDEWGRDSLSVTGHFVYSIYGAYIR